MSEQRFPGWFPPTPEQDRIIEAFLTGDHLVVQAGAGTGKTSTLLHLAHADRSRRGQYVAFNRSIVQEAGRKFPTNVACATAHSLAMRAVGNRFRARMDSGARMRSLEIANRLKIDGIMVKDSAGHSKPLSRTFLAGHALDTVRRFCQSADRELTLYHVPYIEGLDPAGTGRGPVNRFVAEHILPAAQRAWDDLKTPAGGLPFTVSTAMRVILKLWQLDTPRIGADFILYDEAQDASPVMLDIVLQQRHAQLVFVGDSQQQIYRFTGAVDALDRLRETGAEVRFLTQSFRFGPAVADVANHVLSQIPSAELRLIGTDTIASLVGPVAEPDAVLTRTNAAAVETVLNALDSDVKVHLVGGGDDVVRFTRAARDLQQGRRTDHPELACFEDWSEVQAYVLEDSQGGDLRLLVSLVDKFGVDIILGALASQVKESEAELVVSTAHKAKGREWERVRLAGDFPEDKLAGNDDELRLLYVAVTRAQLELDVTAIPFLRDGYSPVVKPLVEVSSGTPPPPAGPVEVTVLESKESEWVGTVGETLTLTVRVEADRFLPDARYGPTHLIELHDDATGAVFKTFDRDGFQPGVTLRLTGRVKSHDTFGSVKETMLNYVSVLEEVEPVTPPPRVSSETRNNPEPVTSIQVGSFDGGSDVFDYPVEAPEPAAPAFVDDGEPF